MKFKGQQKPYAFQAIYEGILAAVTVYTICPSSSVALSDASIGVGQGYVNFIEAVSCDAL